MQIRQLQIAHDTVQDRLVLRLATTDDEEYRAWLTRRFVRTLWPHLAKRMAEPAVPITEVPASDGGSFEQAFQEDHATYPLGSTPLLVSEVKVDVLADGGVDLTFREGRERHFQLGLPPDLLQTFCAMLRAGAEAADWNLTLDYLASSPVPGTTALHSRLH